VLLSQTLSLSVRAKERERETAIGGEAERERGRARARTCVRMSICTWSCVCLRVKSWACCVCDKRLASYQQSKKSRGRCGQRPHSKTRNPKTEAHCLTKRITVSACAKNVCTIPSAAPPRNAPSAVCFISLMLRPTSTPCLRIARPCTLECTKASLLEKTRQKIKIAPCREFVLQELALQNITHDGACSNAPGHVHFLPASTTAVGNRILGFP